MKELTIGVIIVLLLSGCASWSTRDKLAFTAFTVANATDFALTKNGLDNGKIEGNPALSGMESDTVIYYFIGSELLIWGMASVLPDDVRANWFLYPLTVVKVGVAAHNMSIGCEIDF